MKYFIQTIRLCPNFDTLGFKKIEEGLYRNILDNSLWIERNLFDLGWGKEKGLCRTPLLSFEKLLELVFATFDTKSKKITDEQYNFWGALSILLEDYSIEFLDVINNKIKNNEISLHKNRYLLELLNKELFCEEKDIPKINKSFRAKYEKWLEIKKNIN